MVSCRNVSYEMCPNACGPGQVTPLRAWQHGVLLQSVR
jgi:hypothetical protein